MIAFSNHGSKSRKLRAPIFRGQMEGRESNSQKPALNDALPLAWLDHINVPETAPQTGYQDFKSLKLWEILLLQFTTQMYTGERHKLNLSDCVIQMKDYWHRSLGRKNF